MWSFSSISTLWISWAHPFLCRNWQMQNEVHCQMLVCKQNLALISYLLRNKSLSLILDINAGAPLRAAVSCQKKWRIWARQDHNKWQCATTAVHCYRHILIFKIKRRPWSYWSYLQWHSFNVNAFDSYQTHIFYHKEEWKGHCYQVNDSSSKILVIKDDAHLLRRCWRL